MTFVLDKITGQVRRCGYTDFAAGAEFDMATEEILVLSHEREETGRYWHADTQTFQTTPV